MGKLDSVIERMPKGQSSSETTMLALMSNFNALITKSMQDQGVAERLAAEIRSEFKEVGINLGGELSAPLSKAVESAVGAVSKDIVSKVVSDLTQSVEGLEAAVLAEIRAIKFPDFPEQVKTDLNPVLKQIKDLTEALYGIELPSLDVEELKKEVGQKKYWTFDFERNKRTGLLEKVVAS